MPTNPSPDRCDECSARRRLTWRLVEAHPERTYTKLCRACCSASDADFTPLGAIQQALTICTLARCLYDAPPRYKGGAL